VLGPYIFQLDLGPAPLNSNRKADYASYRACAKAMQSRTIALLLATTLLLFALVSHGFSAPAKGPSTSELHELRAENERLRQKLVACEAIEPTVAESSRSSSSSGSGNGSSSSSSGGGGGGGGSASSTSAGSLTRQLLELHAHWDWQAIARRQLQPFTYIDPGMIESAIKECFKNDTMYCARLQVVGGELHLSDYRAVFFDRHYAPARLMPMLDVLRRHPNLPDVDLVVAAVDEPRIRIKVDRMEWPRTVRLYPGFPVAGGGGGLPPPLFSSTIDSAHLDLAWPDFSFYMPRRPHKLRTPPWSRLQPQMLEQSAAISWADKIELAVSSVIGWPLIAISWADKIVLAVVSSVMIVALIRSIQGTWARPIANGSPPRRRSRRPRCL
jgi:hypothetical protein